MPLPQVNGSVQRPEWQRPESQRPESQRPESQVIVPSPVKGAPQVRRIFVRQNPHLQRVVQRRIVQERILRGAMRQPQVIHSGAFPNNVFPNSAPPNNVFPNNAPPNSALPNKRKGRSKRDPHQKRIRYQMRTRKLFVFFCYVFLVAVGVAIMASIVIPTDKYLAQKDIENESRLQLNAVQSENQDLKREIRSYRNDLAIENLARSEYNLIYPGQQVFVILP